MASPIVALILVSVLLLGEVSSTSQGCLDPRNFGAVPSTFARPISEGWRQNTQSIQDTINAATQHPSRCVILSGGHFVTADLYLQSHIVQ